MQTFEVHFLSSGSGGNSTLVSEGDDHFLIDFGIAPERFLSEVRACGVPMKYWREERAAAKKSPRKSRKNSAANHDVKNDATNAQCADAASDATPATAASVPALLGTGPRLVAAIVTHMHTDHFHPRTLKLLCDNNVAVWVHTGHLARLEKMAEYDDLVARNLLRVYGAEPFRLTNRTVVEPVAVSHDSDNTHAFVLRSRTRLRASTSAGASASSQTYTTLHADTDHADAADLPATTEVRFGYVADLGYFPRDLAERFVACDLLALEFNHDEAMQRASGRHPNQIARVLGNFGHLSNAQAADALRRICDQGRRPVPGAVALLHISRDCNTETMAYEAAQDALESMGRAAAHTRVIIARELERCAKIDVAALALQRLRMAAAVDTSVVAPHSERAHTSRTPRRADARSTRTVTMSTALDPDDSGLTPESPSAASLPMKRGTQFVVADFFGIDAPGETSGMGQS